MARADWWWSTYVSPENKIHCGVVSTNEDGVVMHTLRKVYPEAVLDKVEAGANRACFSSEGDIAWNIEYLISLSLYCFVSDKVCVAAKVVHKTVGNIRSSLVDVVFLEAVSLISFWPQLCMKSHPFIIRQIHDPSSKSSSRKACLTVFAALIADTPVAVSVYSS